MIPTVPELTKEIKQNIHKQGLEVFKAFNETYGEMDTCLLSETKSVFWLGMKRIGEGLGGKWINALKPNQEFPKYKPKILAEDQRCVYTLGPVHLIRPPYKTPHKTPFKAPLFGI